VRQRDKPVVTIAPEKRDGDRDTWAVAFGIYINQCLKNILKFILLLFIKAII